MIGSADRLLDSSKPEKNGVPPNFNAACDMESIKTRCGIKSEKNAKGYDSSRIGQFELTIFQIKCGPYWIIWQTHGPDGEYTTSEFISAAGDAVMYFHAFRAHTAEEYGELVYLWINHEFPPGRK